LSIGYCNGAQLASILTTFTRIRFMSFCYSLLIIYLLHIADRSAAVDYWTVALFNSIFCRSIQCL